jgi:hypothetical protein
MIYVVEERKLLAGVVRVESERRRDLLWGFSGLGKGPWRAGYLVGDSYVGDRGLGMAWMILGGYCGGIQALARWLS